MSNHRTTRTTSAAVSSLLTLGLGLGLGVQKVAAVAGSSKACVAFDTNWNLYVFGGSQDVNLGQNTTWSSPSPKTLTTTGRPPWDGNNTQCFLSQYNNALVVVNADSANPSNIYIYNFNGDSWSTQSTSSAPDLSSAGAVLDHDTNIVWALPSGSGQSIYSLDLSGDTTSASSSAAPWVNQGTPTFSGSYTPVMAEASNHLFFFGAPSVSSGSAPLYVVHYSAFQPDAQAFNETNGASSNFPDSSGKAVSVPLASNQAQEQMIFVPDDFSNTYVLTHWTNPSSWTDGTSGAPSGINSFINTTQTLPAPSSKDTGSSYASSDTTLVQLDTSGNIYYLGGAYGNGYAVSSSASWNKLSYTVSGLSSSGSSSSSSNSTSSSGSSSATSSMSATKTGSAGATGSTSGSAASSTSSSSKSAATPGSRVNIAVIGAGLSMLLAGVFLA